MVQKTVKRRLDYKSPDFLIEDIELEFKLDTKSTIVSSRLQVSRNGEHNRPLVLDGEGLELLSLKIDGEDVKEYQQTDNQLLLNDVVDEFVLSICCRINPAENSSLEGLYESDGAFCTQCEAEGFRKITYFMDRPDVLSTYTVTIHASQQYPYLLSNGNEVARGSHDDGTHWVTWQDPFKKPCYLFALVAGDFDRLEDEFVTRSGKPVKLQLFVDKGKSDRGQHALISLKKAMRWDEDVFDLEYDLDIYMIVAVDFFNMGAMENKGLNVFNSKFVLANNETATDEDFFNIESVIAHEYFHNWTGNRVTCRDWFQLSLKEGLTVFRDQLFSETFNSQLATRIKQVKIMREHQFAEDAGPMSHPIRPDEVIEMNNFYTVTVYDKGAEVIRMLWTLLGEDGFKRGMKLYFQRFDGQAVTCDDFVDSMQAANDVDLRLFKRWYSQSGTPVIDVKRTYSAPFEITFRQSTAPTVDQPTKSELFIPLKLEFISSGHSSITEQQQLQLTETSASVRIEDEGSALVVNSGFSAPVKVNYQQTDDELTSILLTATNKLDRWDASQSLYSKAIQQSQLQNSCENLPITNVFSDFIATINDDFELLSEALLPPTLESIIANTAHVDLDTLHQAYQQVSQSVAKNIAPEVEGLVDSLWTNDAYSYDQKSIIRRRCLGSVLKLLAKAGKGEQLIQRLYEQADNMTDSLNALHAAQLRDINLFDSLMADFEQKWHTDALVLDKWFGLHATTDRDDILSRIELLMTHDTFSLKNPNRTRAILGSFAFYNTTRLHASDGSGYRFMADNLIEVDKVNPQVAARIVTPLLAWQKFDESRQESLRFQLTRILDSSSLSSDMYEKVSKALTA